MNAIKLIAILAVTVGISACTGSRTYYQEPVQPLQPAPAGNVQSGQLQPIDGANQTSEAVPAPNTQQIQETQTATLNTQTATQPATQAPSTGGSKITKTAALGAWKASASGANCQLILSLTQNSDKSYRAAPLRCPNGLANVKAWNIEGNQLVLKDSSGTNLVSLNRVGNERYQGGIVTLSR